MPQGKEGTKERESKTKNEEKRAEKERKKIKRSWKPLFQSIQYSKPRYTAIKSIFLVMRVFLIKANLKERSKSTTQEKI